MSPLLRFPRALSLLTCFWAAGGASPALAQSASGALYGVVRDDHGTPLPRATVTVRGEQGEVRTQDTNSGGEFRFLTLEPGLYHATVELADYSTAEYPELPVHVGRSTTIDVILAPSSSGAVTVTAECPLLDERRVVCGAYMTREELDKMPGARDPWTLLEQAPGVLLDRVDVAGADGVQPVVARAAGAGIDQNAYTLDGVVITDPQSLESTPFFYDFGSLEEAQVATGGTNVRVTTPGAAINLVTRRGTNAWIVAARYLVTDGDWQSDQDDLDLGAFQRFFTPSPRLDAIDEYGADAGGPILRDRLWMWGGLNRTEIDLDVAPPPFAFEQGAGHRASDNASIKIDVALEQSNRLQAFVYAHDSEIDGIGAGPTRSLESALDLEAPTEIYKLEDSHVFGPTLFLQAHLSRVEGDVDLEPHGGDAEPSLDPGGVFRDGFLATSSSRDREEARLEISGFFGAEGESHELTLGAGRRTAEVSTLSKWGARNSVFVDDGSASGATTSILFQSGAPEITLDVDSVYVQDTLTTDNLIADVGVRYDSQRGERESALLAAHAVRPDLLPAITLPGTGGEIEWGSLAPRVGLTYAIGEEHATLLRASWSRFADQLGTSMFDDVIPAPQLSPFAFAAVRFFDRDGDRQADSNETQSAILGTMGGTVIDPSLGAPLTDEILFGAEHAGAGCFSIGGRLTWRHYKDLLDRRPFVRDAAGDVRVATRDDYVPDTIATGQLPDETPYAVPVFALRPDLDADRDATPRQRWPRDRVLRRHRLARAPFTQPLGAPRLRQRPRGDGRGGAGDVRARRSDRHLGPRRQRRRAVRSRVRLRRPERCLSPQPLGLHGRGPLPRASRHRPRVPRARPRGLSPPLLRGRPRQRRPDAQRRRHRRGLAAAARQRAPARRPRREGAAVDGRPGRGDGLARRAQRLEPDAAARAVDAPRNRDHGLRARDRRPQGLSRGGEGRVPVST